MFRTKYLSVAMLLFSGHAVIAQDVRDLRPPVAVQEPLTDSVEATRLFYLSLGSMSAAHRNSFLKSVGLTDAEVLAASAAAATLKTNHDENAKNFLAQAKRMRTTDEDLTAYRGIQDALLQQLQNGFSVQLSSTSLKSLENTIESRRTSMSVYKFFIEVPSEMPDYTQTNTPRLQTAAFHPARPIICPKGTYPYHIIDISGTVSGSITTASSDGVNVSLTMVGNGTYTATQLNTVTCIAPPPPQFFNVELNASLSNGSGIITNFDGAQAEFCAHEAIGPINLATTSASNSFINSQDPTNPTGGLTGFDVIQWLNNVKNKIASLTNYFQVANTWSLATSAPIYNSATGLWFYTLASYCTNTTNPDWDPGTAYINVSNMVYLYSSAFCLRQDFVDTWFCGPVEFYFQPHPLSPMLGRSNCTKTGPQPG